MIAVQETPTRLLLAGPTSELLRLQDEFSYQPASFWRADSYQIWLRHQRAIAAAQEEGNIALAESLAARKVGWDGWKQLLSVLPNRQERTTASGNIQRGHKSQLLEVAENFGIKLDLTKLLSNPFEGIVLDDIPDDLLAADLDPEQWAIQKRCVLSWLAHGMARHMVSVSGGKTVMFCAAAAMVKKRFPNSRFLYLTPTERLVRQVTIEAKRFLPDWDITQFGGAGRDNQGKDMVICTDAILNKRFAALNTSGWFKTFICILNDEAQYSAAPSRSKVLLATPAYFRFSASDTTAEDNPDKHRALVGLCGVVEERVEIGELLDIDAVAQPTIEIISCPAWKGKFNHLSHEPEPNTPAYFVAEGQWFQAEYLGHSYELDKDGEFLLDRKKEKVPVPGVHLLKVGPDQFEVQSRWCLLERRYDKAISSFTERNNDIARRAASYSNNGWPTLIVATRTLHVMVLEACLSKLIDNSLVRTLYGHDSSDDRNDTFAWLKGTPGAVLISPLVKVGVSINEIRAGIIADYVADHEYMRQLIGRFVRKKPDGTPNDAVINIYAENQHSSYKRGAAKVIDKLKTTRGYRWNEVTL